MLRIVKFETRYPPNRDPEDWVLTAPAGEGFDKTQTWHRVKTMVPQENLTDREKDAEHHQAMLARWSIVEPAYEAWRQGNEIPVDGTPLETWSAVSAEQVRALKAMAIRTVEEVRDMGDSAVSALRFPNARKLPDLAAKFLDGRSLAEKDQELAEVKERMAAMEEMLEKATQPQKPPRARKDAKAA